MAPRVMLLLLAVGAFVAIWSGDLRRDRGRLTSTAAQSGATGTLVEADGVQPQESPAVAPLRKPHPMVAKRVTDRTPELVETQAATNDAGHCDAADSTIATSQIPLPGGITPGEYRIVRSDGRVMHWQLSAGELAERGLLQNEPPRSLYLLHDGRLRWYFVRVETGKSEVVGDEMRPAGSSNGSAPPVVARKPHQASVASHYRLTPAGWLRKPMIVRAQSVWNQCRTAAMQVIADSFRTSKNLIGAAVERFRQAAVRMQRHAAETRPTRR